MVKTIRVPKTPVSAYNPTRASSSLIKAHVANLEAATRRHAHAKPTRQHRNEAQAASYIAEMTRELHPHAEQASVAPSMSAASRAMAVMPAGRTVRASSRTSPTKNKSARKKTRKRTSARGRKK
jgi:hypothetical protein